MKRKLLSLSLTIITCLACVFGITACNSDKPNDNGNGQGTIQTPPEEKPDDKDKPTDVVVTGVTLNSSTISLEVGASQTLTASVLPNNATDKTVTWKSSDTSIATVENGKVTAVKAGTATITATTANEKMATCKVTVTEKPVPHTHALTLVPSKEPDCEIAGNIGYYTCACGKWFSDSAAKNEITDKNSVIVKATGHSYSKDWTYNETQHWHIAICEHTTLTTTPQNHTFENDVCTVCGYNNLPAQLKGITGGTVDDAKFTAYLLKDKTTTTVNLSTMIAVSENCSWKLYDEDSNLIATKRVTPTNGENIYLIVVTSSDGLYENTYELNLYKSFEITVSYYDVYNNAIHSETADTGYNYDVSYVPDITGYTFNYWKLNGEQTNKLTPFENVNLSPDCTANSYTVTLDPDGGEVDKSEQVVTFDESFALPVPTKTGYTFTGWFEGETKITNADGVNLSNSKFSAATTLTANWQVNSYNLTVDCNNNSYGSVSGGGTHEYNSSRTITAITKSGYTFIGWYDGETKLCNNLTYIFNMPAEDTNYTAKWIKVTIQADNQNCSVNALNGKYIVDEKVTVTATTYLGYTWGGWYNGEKELTKSLCLTFNMPAEDTIYTAKWEVNDEMSNFEFTSTATTCKINGVIDKTVTEVSIPQYVTSIKGEILNGCTNIKSLTLPFIGASRTSLSNLSYLFSKDNSYKFSYNEYTKYDNCDTVYEVGDYYRIYMGDAYSSRTLYKRVQIGTIIKGDKEEPYYNDYYLYYYYGYLIPKSLETISIVDGNIPTNAFYNCSWLTGITMPESAASIGNYAFCNCTGLTSVNIPDSVTSIGEGAFYNCTGLTSVIIPDSAASIGEGAFYKCSKLTSITIPVGVRSISASAFGYCSSLQNIYYGGTKAQWGNISIGGSNSYLTGAERYYYSAEEPALNADGTAYDGNYWHYVDGEIVVWEKKEN